MGARGDKYPQGVIELENSWQKYSQVPKKQGVLINRGIRKISEINK